MNINYGIGRDTLGDCNSDADNERYVDAVRTALTNEYPDADVSVSIAEHSACAVTDCDAEITQNIDRIAGLIWGRANY